MECFKICKIIVILYINLYFPIEEHERDGESEGAWRVAGCKNPKKNAEEEWVNLFFKNIKNYMQIYIYKFIK